MSQIQKRQFQITASENSPKKCKTEEKCDELKHKIGNKLNQYSPVNSSQKNTIVDLEKRVSKSVQNSQVTTKTCNLADLNIIPILINHNYHIDKTRTKSLNNNAEKITRQSFAGNLIYLTGAPKNGDCNFKNHSDLSETDLKVLLQNFYKLEGDEQQRLITHLKKLETYEPEFVEKLSKFVRVSSPAPENCDLNDLDDLDDILDETTNLLTDCEVENDQSCLDTEIKDAKNETKQENKENVERNTAIEKTRENLKKTVNNNVWQKHSGNVKRKAVNKVRQLISYDDLQVFYPSTNCFDNCLDNQKLNLKNELQKIEINLLPKTVNKKDSKENNFNDNKIEIQQNFVGKELIEENKELVEIVNATKVETKIETIDLTEETQEFEVKIKPEINDSTEKNKPSIKKEAQKDEIKCKTETINVTEEKHQVEVKPKILIVNSAEDNKLSVKKEQQKIKSEFEIIDLTDDNDQELEDNHVDISQNIKKETILYDTPKGVNFKQEFSIKSVKKEQVSTKNSSNKRKFSPSNNLQVSNAREKNKQQETKNISNEIKESNNTLQKTPKIPQKPNFSNVCQSFSNSLSHYVRKRQERIRRFDNFGYTPEKYNSRRYFLMDPSTMSPEMQAQYFGYQSYDEMKLYREMTGIYCDQNSYYSFSDNY